MEWVYLLDFGNMPTELLYQDVWKRITQLSKTCARAQVAVAYVSKGARNLLTLGPGSLLVVDACEDAVRSRCTNPAELLYFQRKGVEIHSVANLHAKVFVFGSRAIIGSANVSNRSADYLQEAVVETSERNIVASCRAFVLKLRGEVLERPHLLELQNLYNSVPAKGIPRRSETGSRSLVTHAPLWLVPLQENGWDEAEKRLADLGRPEAKRKLNRRFFDLDEFSWKGNLLYSELRVGDLVLQVTDTPNAGTMFSRAAHVVHIQRSRGQSRRMIVFLASHQGIRRKSRGAVLTQLGKYRTLIIGVKETATQVEDEGAIHALLNLWT